MEPLRRLARPAIASSLVAVAVAAVLCLTPAPVVATSGTKTTFAAVFDRSALVIVATVQDAPTVSAGYRLTVERVIKGTAGTILTFAPDPMAVALVPGQRVVLLLADPSGLDFRGTTVLVVSSSGSIDPDGLADVPATITDLEAAYGGASASPPATTTLPPLPARDPIPLVVLAGIAFLAGAAAVLAQGTLARRRRA